MAKHTISKYQIRNFSRSSGKILLLFLLVIGTIGLTGCTEGQRGIFATIAIEEEIKKNNLVDNASISGLVRSDFGGAEMYVAVVGTKLFERVTSGDDWDEISGPGSNLAQYIVGVDTDPPGYDQLGVAEEVYVVYQSSRTQDGIVYRLTDTLGWEVAYVPTATFVDGMVAVEDTLFVSTADGKLHIWDGGSDPDITNDAPTSTLAGFNDGIRDGVRYKDDFYVLGMNGLLAHVPSGLGAVTAFSTTTSSPQPRGIGVSPYEGGIIAVVDATGPLYVSNSNTPESGPSEWKSAGSIDRSPSDIVWVDVLNNGDGGFLVSTSSDALRSESGRGYYEVDISGTSGTYTATFTNDIGNRYQASDLAVASINQLKHFGNGVVFALTGGIGLWSTVYPGAGDPNWTYE